MIIIHVIYYSKILNDRNNYWTHSMNSNDYSKWRIFGKMHTKASRTKDGKDEVEFRKKLKDWLLKFNKSSLVIFSCGVNAKIELEP